MADRTGDRLLGVPVLALHLRGRGALARHLVGLGRGPRLGRLLVALGGRGGLRLLRLAVVVGLGCVGLRLLGPAVVVSGLRRVLSVGVRLFGPGRAALLLGEPRPPVRSLGPLPPRLLGPRGRLRRGVRGRRLRLRRGGLGPLRALCR